MSTSGEKVPSCQRSGGSPSSEYTAPCSPAPCFPGLPFSKLSRRQLDMQLLCACGLDLLCLLSFPSKAIHWDFRKGLPGSLSSVFPSSPVSLSLSHCLHSVLLRCFVTLGSPSSLLPHALPQLQMLSAGSLYLASGSKLPGLSAPSPPHPAVPWLVWM